MRHGINKLVWSAVLALACLGCTSRTLPNEIVVATGTTGTPIEDLKNLVRPWEEKTGYTVTFLPMPASTSDQFAQYRTWLAARASDVDVYRTDVIWAAQLANYFVDLKDAAVDVIPHNFPSVIQSQTVDGRLVALPAFADAPALFYRADLLEKYQFPVPATWDEMAATAGAIQQAERAAGNRDIWGYVWQGNAYESLTCNALEWVASFGGGHIIEPDGTISINNPHAARALTMVAAWVGEIAPRGVLSYQEEDARGVWQTGNAVFMRNWGYAYGLSGSDDSAVKGKFGVAPMPAGDAGAISALGGWNYAVSKYSRKQHAAIDLVLWLASPEGQKRYTLAFATLPTITALYDDPEVIELIPVAPQWKDIFLSAVPRPSATAKSKYNEVSAKFWSAVHNVISGLDRAEDALEVLEAELDEIKGHGW